MARRRKNKNRLNIILFVGIILFAGIGTMFWYMSNQGAVDGKDTREIYVEVPQGSSTGKIASILHEHDLIQSEFIFKSVSKSKGFASQYKSGDFTFSRNMNMAQIMAILQEGENNLVKITIPEGFTQKQIKDRLVKEGVLTAEAFDEEVKNGQFDYAFLEGIDRQKYGLEGYLFPKTYMMNKNSNAHEIIDRLLKQFEKEVPEEYYARAKEIGMTMNQVVILAAIIEREAVVESDRPIISGVFHNRLDIGMQLQSCATVQYALGEVKPRLTYKDIAIDSPYNTYKISGLPPAPICSPRLDSIKVALYPTESDYLYFVAKGDGSHAFSKTNAEHEANKKKYL